MIITEPLVSIITPCYNGATFVHRLLNSILHQTYSNIEFFFINDGSTDDTESIVLAYKEKFKQRNIIFKYIYQKNAGQCAAVANILPQVSGDYLIWPDSDDWLSNDSIEKRVSFLENHPDYGSVFCEMALYSEDDASKCIEILTGDNPSNEWQFELLITHKAQICSCNMIRMSAFVDVNPTKSIYISKLGGQNAQLLMPVYHKYKRGFIQEPLHCCLIRKNSHSRTLQRKPFDMLDESLLIITETLKTMDISQADINKYSNLARVWNFRHRLVIAKWSHSAKHVKKYYEYLTKTNNLTKDDKEAYFIACLYPLNIFFAAFRKLLLR